MVLKGVSWVDKDEIRSNGPKRSQLGTQPHRKAMGFGSKTVVFEKPILDLDSSHN